MPGCKAREVMRNEVCVLYAVLSRSAGKDEGQAQSRHGGTDGRFSTA
jgi:hypothetical protein